MHGRHSFVCLLSIFLGCSLSACVLPGGADDDNDDEPYLRDAGGYADSLPSDARRSPGGPFDRDASGDATDRAETSSGDGGHRGDSCPGDKKRCNGQCVDTSDNAQHCGGCGQQCPAGGFYCSNSKCQCIGSELTACNGSCVDTSSNEEHCGKCGKTCSGGKACRSGSCEELTEVEAVIRETNEWRSQEVRCPDGSGLHRPTNPVEGNAELHRAAQYHAENMAEVGFFAHDQCGAPPQGGCQTCSSKSNCHGPQWRVKTQSNYSGSPAVGENIAYGQTSPAQAVQTWIDSKEGHCRNIMNSQWNRIGVGHATTESGREYWVQVFGVVEE